MKRILLVIATLALAAASFVACADDMDALSSGQDGGSGQQQFSTRAQPAARGVEVAADQPAVTEENETAAMGYGGSASAKRPAGVPALGPSVIKTARVRIEVERDGFRDAVQEAMTTAQAHGGFVISTRIDGEGSREGSVVIRVPAERFERALDDIHALGDVKGELVSGQDVTEEFIDLAARLRHFEAQEAVLLDLMGRAVTVADTIRVQHELQGIQLEMERLRGRLRFLRDQTDFSTIEVALEEAGAAPAPKNVISRAWDKAREMFLSVVSGTIIAAGFVLPIAVLMAAAYLAFRALRPRFGSS